MKIAVTGASGFLGGHVIDTLARREGIEIVATSRRPLAPDLAALGVRHVPLELTEVGDKDYERLGRPDRLIHLAWGGLPNYLSPRHFEVELPLQYRFLRALIDQGLPSLLVTGTCYEYGMVDGELHEGMPAAPTNPYGFAKAALLRQLELLQASMAFDLCWARLFYMYGPGQNQASLYSLLQAAIARGDATFPMSKGEQLRDFLPVAEIAGNIVDLALQGGGAGVVNVSSGIPVSIRGLVERWIAEAGSDIVPVLGQFPYPSYEPLAFWGSSAKRRSILSASA